MIKKRKGFKDLINFYNELESSEWIQTYQHDDFRRYSDDGRAYENYLDAAKDDFKKTSDLFQIQFSESNIAIKYDVKF